MTIRSIRTQPKFSLNLARQAGVVFPLGKVHNRFQTRAQVEIKQVNYIAYWDLKKGRSIDDSKWFGKTSFPVTPYGDVNNRKTTCINNLRNKPILLFKVLFFRGVPADRVGEEKDPLLPYPQREA